MFCKNCGFKLPDESKYCYQCGTIFGEKIEEKTSQAQMNDYHISGMEPVENYQNKANYENSAETGPRGIEKIIKICVISLGTFLIVSIIIFGILNLF